MENLLSAQLLAPDVNPFCNKLRVVVVLVYGGQVKSLS